MILREVRTPLHGLLSRVELIREFEHAEQFPEIGYLVESGVLGLCPAGRSESFVAPVFGIADALS